MAKFGIDRELAQQADSDLAAGNLSSPAMIRVMNLARPSAVFGMPGDVGTPNALRKALERNYGLSPAVARYVIADSGVQAAFRRSARIRLITGLTAVIFLAAFPLPSVLARWLISKGDAALGSLVLLIFFVALYHTFQAAYVLMKPSAAPGPTPPAAPHAARVHADNARTAQYCRKCGAKASPGDTFCGRCGAPMAEPGA